MLTTFTLPKSELVDSSTKLRMCGASMDSVLLAFTASGGTPSGAIVVAILLTLELTVIIHMQNNLVVRFILLKKFHQITFHKNFAGQKNQWSNCHCKCRFIWWDKSFIKRCGTCVFNVLCGHDCSCYISLTKCDVFYVFFRNM